MSKKIYILDAFGMLFRNYHGVKEKLINRAGQETQLLVSFIKTIQFFQKHIDLNRLVFVFEGKDNFRKKLSSTYKANRNATPEDFLEQVEIIKKWIDKIGFLSSEKYGFEADDLIATITKKYEKKGWEVFIISNDKDFYQLLTSKNITILQIENSKFLKFTAEDFQKQFGIQPHQFIDFQIMVGDMSDNISGIKGIGEKTAIKLLKKFKDINDIYNNLDKLTKGEVKKLQIGRDDLKLTRELITLKTDLEIDDFEFNNIPPNPLINIIDELFDFDIIEPLEKTGLLTFNEIAEKDRWNFKFDTHILTTFDEVQTVFKNVPENSIIAFDTETTGLNPSSKIVGFSFAINEFEGYYIPIAHKSLFDFAQQATFEEAKKIIEFLTKFNLIGHNIKYDKHIIWNNFKIDLPIHSDTMILAWLINPSEPLNLDYLTYHILKHRKIKFKNLTKEDFSAVEIETGAKYSVEDVIATLKLFREFIGRFDNSELEILKNIEIPIIDTIFRMEKTGIAVDFEKLDELELQFKNDIEKIQKEIYQMAGQEFNLNSPKQVSKILFDVLKIPTKKRKTDEVTLKELQNQSPIISAILEYRKIFKLISTYINPIREFGKLGNGRVKTQFGQTGTVTGRLNSTNPNMQNIPTENHIREIFIAEKGYFLLSLDYSQIELRFFAHFSQDKDFVEAFKNGDDIHSVVAEKLGVQRNIAKTINFGLLYGMGVKKLAQTLEIKESEASQIMKNYHNTFPAIHSFFQTETEKILQRGFVETILGRKRYFLDPTSHREKAAIQREAFNTIFQGSVADLIKKAMVEIDKTIIENQYSAKLLLQIHDELIFEVKKEEVDKLAEIFQNIMENSLKLNIPIVVNRKIGEAWK